jgi:indole-3-glycerol phosphate synthase
MILDEIIAHKRTELVRLPAVDRSLLRDLPPCRGFRAALRRPAGERIRVIAECKKASPSKGVLAASYDPVVLAYQYLLGGAAACSVLTDERFFQGALEHLAQVRAAVPLPLIRKDFTLDPRQIAEARLAGADAILLIAACLEDGRMRDLHGFASEIGMDALVEVHDADEAARALRLGAGLIGINNRDLQRFTVDVGTTLALAPPLIASGCTVVSESGIGERAQCRQLEEIGVDAVLVGESLVVSQDPVAALRRLRGDLLSGAVG